MMLRASRRVPAAAAALLAITAAVGPLAAQQPDDAAAVARRLAAIERFQAEMAATLLQLNERLSELQALLTKPRGEPPAPPLPQALIPLSDLPLRGDPGAGAVVIEFTDFECSFCGVFARQTLPALLDKYVASAKVRWGVWHLPMPELHPHALNAAESAECARRQNRFWEMHSALFGDQSRLDQASLASRARTLGLDMAQFGDCVQSTGALKIRREASAARTLGVAVTPTFFVGTVEGDRLRVRGVIVGVKDVTSFSSQLDALLGGSPAADPR